MNSYKGIKPLLLSERTAHKPNTFASASDPVLCLLCEKEFTVNPTNAPMLHHLLTVHKLVIADIKLVADLRRYLQYWREHFKNKSLTDFCSVIKTNSKEDDQAPSECYFLLSDILPEDKMLREKLQKERLDAILEQQQIERTDTKFSRKCLFCGKHFTASRVDLFNHMLEDHNFSVGQPDNIVFGNELLDVLEDKLKNLQCLFCEKTFKDWQILKEHMRKKQHRKINPKNTSYDKFYVINYLEMGKNWEALQAEDKMGDLWPEENSSENIEWEDWKEEGIGAVCLFCKYSSPETEDLLTHMKMTHKFDLWAICEELNFYQQVKLVNYIRRQMYHNQCIICQMKCNDRQSLLDHLLEMNHTASVPETSLWDQPQYFFPTYEDDHLLCVLDDDDETEEAVKHIVIPEDPPQNNPETLKQILTENSFVIS